MISDIELTWAFCIYGRSK